MNLEINEIRVTLNALLDHLEATGQQVIEIEDDFYWEIPAECRYDPYQVVEGASLGQLSDDLTEVRSMMAGQRPTIGYGLVWLSSLIRRVGEKSMS